MVNPIIRGFTGLTRFSGRDARGTFWPYAGVVIAGTIAVIFMGMGWAMTGIFEDMNAFAATHPEAATVHSAPGQYSIYIDADHPDAPTPDFGPFFLVMMVGVVATVILLAAAISRRLHDTGLRAFWGLLPVPFLIGGGLIFHRLMSSMASEAEPPLSLFFAGMVNNLIYLVALATLIILLARPGTAGPNRYGAATG